MICPMKFNAHTLDVEGDCLRLANICEENDCAWYDEKNECCIIRTLATNISNIKVTVAR